MNIVIKKLLLTIAKLPDADKIYIFGSVASNKENPGDLDVALIDMSLRDSDIAMKNYPVTTAKLRALARVHYGWLDPFIVTKGPLTVRNDEATGWINARKSRDITKAIKTNGIPIIEYLKTHKIEFEEAVEEPCTQNSL